VKTCLRLSLLTYGIGLSIVSASVGCTTYQQCRAHGCAGDAEVTATVQARLNEHAALESPNLITVQTLGHVVYLYGVVNTVLERDLAGDVAQETPDVVKVVNSIGISSNR
jgi:osmotically-inducible protein OsmY